MNTYSFKTSSLFSTDLFLWNTRDEPSPFSRPSQNWFKFDVYTPRHLRRISDLYTFDHFVFSSGILTVPRFFYTLCNNISEGLIHSVPPSLHLQLSRSLHPELSSYSALDMSQFQKKKTLDMSNDTSSIIESLDPFRGRCHRRQGTPHPPVDCSSAVSVPGRSRPASPKSTNSCATG